MSEDRQERFGSYVEALAEVIGHADRAEPLRDYCLGLLLPGERKSVGSCPAGWCRSSR
jgi:SRSO17 transposase